MSCTSKSKKPSIFGSLSEGATFRTTTELSRRFLLLTLLYPFYSLPYSSVARTRTMRRCKLLGRFFRLRLQRGIMEWCGCSQTVQNTQWPSGSWSRAHTPCPQHTSMPSSKPSSRPLPTSSPSTIEHSPRHTPSKNRLSDTRMVEMNTAVSTSCFTLTL